MDEMIRKTNELLEKCDKDDFDQWSYLVGFVDALEWAKANS